MNAFLTGLGLSLSLIVAIGAQNTFVLRQGLRREHVGPVVALCAWLDVLLMTLGVSGVAAALDRFAGALNALGLLGAAVLAVYALMALRRALSPQTLQAAAGGAPMRLATVLLNTLSLSLLNPHVYLDTVVLVGAVGARQPAGQQLPFLLGAGLASVAWFAALGYGARLLTPLFARPRAWQLLDFLVALMMAWIAGKLVLHSLGSG